MSTCHIMELVVLFNSSYRFFSLHILNVARGLGSVVKYSRLLTTDCEFDPLSHQLNIFKGGMYWFFLVWRKMLPYTELGLSCVVDAPVHRAWFVMCGGHSRTPSLVCHVWWTLLELRANILYALMPNGNVQEHLKI